MVSYESLILWMLSFKIRVIRTQPRPYPMVILDFQIEWEGGINREAGKFRPKAESPINWEVDKNLQS